jgi:hypothetical protein
MKPSVAARYLVESTLVVALSLFACASFGHIEQPDTIDMVSLGKDKAEVNLGIVQHNPWNERTLSLLERKLKAYESFVKDGELHRRYPQTAGKSVVVEVAYFEVPGPEATKVLQGHAARLEASSIKFRWFKLPTPK